VTRAEENTDNTPEKTAESGDSRAARYPAMNCQVQLVEHIASEFCSWKVAPEAEEQKMVQQIAD